MYIVHLENVVILSLVLLNTSAHSQVLTSNGNMCSKNLFHEVYERTSALVEYMELLTLQINDIREDIRVGDEKIQDIEKGYTEVLQRLDEKRSHIIDCGTLHSINPSLPDGVYRISLKHDEMVSVFCNMSDGGWTVFQRRISGEVNFYRNWSDYRIGFGDAAGEYWLGNEFLHQLTRDRNCLLKIDMVNWDDLAHFAQYTGFRVDNETEGYRLHAENYSGDANDSLSLHNGHKFSTLDVDNDTNRLENCAVEYTGAWWYANCHHSNLNGDYSQRNGKGVKWWQYPGSDYMKETVMKLKCT